LFLTSAEVEEDSCIILSIIVATTLFWLHFPSVKAVKDSRVFVLFGPDCCSLCGSRSDKT
jgi:hypothetical protein